MNDQVAQKSNIPEPWYARRWPENWWRFSIKPVFIYRKADQWNTVRYGFDWLFLHIWTRDSIGLEISFQLDCNIGVQVHIPYLIIRLSIPILPVDLGQKFWRRPPRLGPLGRID